MLLTIINTPIHRSNNQLSMVISSTSANRRMYEPAIANGQLLAELRIYHGKLIEQIVKMRPPNSQSMCLSRSCKSRSARGRDGDLSGWRQDWVPAEKIASNSASVCVSLPALTNRVTKKQLQWKKERTAGRAYRRLLTLHTFSLFSFSLFPLP